MEGYFINFFLFQEQAQHSVVLLYILNRIPHNQDPQLDNHFRSSNPGTLFISGSGPIDAIELA